MDDEEIIFSKMVKGNYYKIAGLGLLVRRLFNDVANECVIVTDKSKPAAYGRFLPEPTKYKYIHVNDPIEPMNLMADLDNEIIGGRRQRRQRQSRHYKRARRTKRTRRFKRRR